jgi:RNA polymerase sigma factor (TIGR02999 family)
VGREEITRLLKSLSDGDEGASEALWPLVYDQLRMMAADFMRSERSDHTLQPTALVHEAYLRMVDQHQARYVDRSHFFALAARMMRRILVDHARRKKSHKRDGGVRVPVESVVDLGGSVDGDVDDLDHALRALEELDPDKARIVELRFFGGLSMEEVARVLDCSERTVRRHWETARLWLYRELKRGSDDAN